MILNPHHKHNTHSTQKKKDKKNLSLSLHCHNNLGSRGLPTPCLGFGLSAGGFCEGNVMGTSITSYLTRTWPSGASTEKERSNKTIERWNFHNH